MKRNEYLIIPSRPTPNGRLHIGHLAGPYLRADILSRSLKRMGHNVYMITGCDVFDEYVAYEAFINKLSHIEVVTRNANLIQTDLKKLNIDYDCFINAADEKHHSDCNAIARMLCHRLNEKMYLYKKHQSYRYCSKIKKYLQGPWVSGNCYQCKKNMVGSICENCAAYQTSDQMHNVIPLVSSEFIEAATFENIFLRCDKKIIEKSVLEMCIQKKYKQFALSLCKKMPSIINLTLPLSYGITVDYRTSTYKYLNTYCSLYVYRMLFAKLYQEYSPYSQPFTTESAVTTIATFGKDNLLSYSCIDPLFANVMPDQKSFDCYIVNEFLLWEGRKFSTSAQHVLYLENLLCKSVYPVDRVRYYLATLNLEDPSTHFDLDVYHKNSTVRLNKILDIAHKFYLKYAPAHPENTEKKSEIMTLAENIIAEQSALLQPSNFCPSKGLALVDKWCEYSDLLYNYRFIEVWLAVLAFLMLPYTPTIACEIWQKIRKDGLPSLDQLPGLYYEGVAERMQKDSI